MPRRIARRMKSGAPSVKNARLVGGVYQAQFHVPDHLQQTVAKLTGFRNRPGKDGKLPDTFFQTWLIRSTKTGNAREADRIISEQIMPEFRAIIAQAEAWADPASVVATMESDPNSMSIAQAGGGLSRVHAAAALDAIADLWREGAAYDDKVAGVLATVRAALAKPAHRDWDTLRSRMLDTVAVGSAARVHNGVNGKPLPLAEAIEVWATNRKPRKPGPRAISTKQRAMKRLFDFLETRDGSRNEDLVWITADDLQDFKDYAAKQQDTDGYGDVIEVRALFKSMKDNRRLIINLAADVSNVVKPEKKSQRVSFTTAERARWISKARASASPVIRIAGLIIAFTGAHVEEVIEANTRDIEIRPNGTPVFHIRELHRGPNQRLKTDCRERILPLHSAIRAEVLSYHAQIIAEYGPGPLFPMVRADKHGRQNTYASNQIMAWMRSKDGADIQNDGKLIKDSYCWRRTVRTIYTNARVDPDRARYLLGHAAKDIDADYIDHEIAECAKAVETIDDPTA